MPISAVIRCHEDPEIKECISSLLNCDQSHEIVAVLTETSRQIGDLIKKMPQTKIVWAPVGNLSVSSNLGIESSSNDRVVILDSDLTFSNRYLDVIDTALDNNALVKSAITFQSTNYLEHIIGTLRQSVYDSGVFYCPGVAFRKDVKEKIGDHFFNDRVWWTEDAELNFRIKMAGIPIYYEPNALVIHQPVGIKHDLNAAYKIGQGKYSQVLYAQRKTYEEGLLNTARRIISGKTINSMVDLYKRTNSLGIVSYDAIWSFLYYTGYYKALVQNIYNR